MLGFGLGTALVCAVLEVKGPEEEDGGRQNSSNRSACRDESRWMYVQEESRDCRAEGEKGLVKFLRGGAVGGKGEVLRWMEEWEWTYHCKGAEKGKVCSE